MAASSSAPSPLPGVVFLTYIENFGLPEPGDARGWAAFATYAIEHGVPNEIAKNVAREANLIGNTHRLNLFLIGDIPGYQHARHPAITAAKIREVLLQLPDERFPDPDDVKGWGRYTDLIVRSSLPIDVMRALATDADFGSHTLADKYLGLSYHGNPEHQDNQESEMFEASRIADAVHQVGDPPLVDLAEPFKTQLRSKLMRALYRNGVHKAVSNEIYLHLIQGSTEVLEYYLKMIDYSPYTPPLDAKEQEFYDLQAIGLIIHDNLVEYMQDHGGLPSASNQDGWEEIFNGLSKDYVPEDLFRTIIGDFGNVGGVDTINLYLSYAGFDPIDRIETKSGEEIYLYTEGVKEELTPPSLIEFPDRATNSPDDEVDVLRRYNLDWDY